MVVKIHYEPISPPPPPTPVLQPSPPPYYHLNHHHHHPSPQQLNSLSSSPIYSSSSSGDSPNSSPSFTPNTNTGLCYPSLTATTTSTTIINATSTVSVPNDSLPNLKNPSPSSTSNKKSALVQLDPIGNNVDSVMRLDHNLQHRDHNVSDDLCKLKVSSSHSNDRMLISDHSNNHAVDNIIIDHEMQQPHYQNNKNNSSSFNKKIETNSDEPPSIIKDEKSNVIYHRGKLLGKGGFAKVYELTHTKTKRVYADKVINKEIFQKKSSSKEKVKREIGLHKDLIHKNVVRFYNYFDDDHYVHIVLENCSMKSLLHVLKHRKSLLEPEVRYYMKHICDGVRYIHKHEILHRDLKLGNMFLTHDMIVKIGDFGLATKIGQEKSSTLCGTPNYIAPEVLAKKGHGMEADVWALGCMMYAMLVGTPPFETKSLNATYEKISRNDYTIPEMVSIGSEAMIRKLLHPHPHERPHLLQTGHPHDILSHAFFQKGYLPPILPVNAAYQIPTFPSSSETHLDRGNNSISYSKKWKSCTMDSMTKKQMISALPTTTTTTTTGSNNAASSHPYSYTSSSSSSSSSSNSNPGDSMTGSGSNLGIRSTIKQKISQIFTQQDRKKETPSPSQASFQMEMYDQIVICLKNMQQNSRNCDSLMQPPEVNVIPVFVAKWIDYSNKYGFGYQMSDKSMGVLFNDSSKLNLSPERSVMSFTDIRNKTVHIQTRDANEDMLSKIRLLEYFAKYMDENLADCSGNMFVQATNRLYYTNNGLPPGAKNSGTGTNLAQIPAAPTSSALQVTQWIRTSAAVIMVMNNCSVQINFLTDHLKMVLFKEGQDYFATLITSEKTLHTFTLSSISAYGNNSHLICSKLYQALTLFRTINDFCL